jgi:hypothetical protein
MTASFVRDQSLSSEAAEIVIKYLVLVRQAIKIHMICAFCCQGVIRCGSKQAN